MAGIQTGGDDGSVIRAGPLDDADRSVTEFREAAADRLERAADRMYNSGYLEEERRFREAAAQIRGGLVVEEARALERSMLFDQTPSLVNRLVALAGQGEYDGGGLDAQGSSESSMGDVPNEPSVTATESGASQLLSTAFSPGLSNPYDPAQGRWMSASLGINPFTTATGDDAGGFTAGQSIDSFTGQPSEDDNPNSYTTGQNINPSSGSQDTESFSGGGAPTQTPPPTNSEWAAFGLSGPPAPLIASPDLQALNEAIPANPNLASDATSTAPVPPPLQVVEEQWAYTAMAADQAFSTYYWRFDAPDGTMYALTPAGGGPVVIYSTSDNSVIGRLDANGNFVNAGTQQPDALQPPQQTPTPQQTTPTPTATPTIPQLTADADAQLNAAIQQAVGPADPNTANAGPPTGIDDVLAGTNAAPSDPTQGQPSDQAGSYSGESASQIQEENWDAAKAGMWDSVVDMAQGLMNMSLMALNPAGLLGPKPSLDWAKSGPPAPTGDPVRDAELQDNYTSGGWVTTTISLALPIGAEGILDSALSASSKLPALTGLGMGGGGEVVGFMEQWLAQFGESSVLEGGAAWHTQEVEEALQAMRDSGLRVSANGPESWTARQIEGAIEYQKAFMEVYDNGGTISHAGSAGGGAFHDFMEAAERGIDARYFNANVEYKTSFGTPSADTVLDAVAQVERYAPGQLNVVHFFDMLNGVKYFIQW